MAVDFDGVESVYNDIAVVIKNGKMGALDCRGFQHIVPCDYDKIERSWMSEKRLVKPVKQGKKGLANAEGTVLIPPVYEDIDERFDTELGGFRIKNHGKWGLVDAKGKTKIPPVEYAINSKGEIIVRQQNRD